MVGSTQKVFGIVVILTETRDMFLELFFSEYEPHWIKTMTLLDTTANKNPPKTNKQTKTQQTKPNPPNLNPKQVNHDTPRTAQQNTQG